MEFCAMVQLGDLDGDGRIDMWLREPGAALPHWLSYLNGGGPGGIQDFTATPFFALEGHRAAAMDLDGDGRAELFAVDPLDGTDPTKLVPIGLNDDGQPTALPNPWQLPGTGPYSLPRTFADLNGDGLRDSIQLFNDPKEVRYNTGRGFLPPENLDLPGKIVDMLVGDSGLRVVDFDGDGREDLLSLEQVDNRL